jgi:hypothetical protein
VWNFLPEGHGSSHGITSVKFEAEEFGDGHELAATAAFATDANVSAPSVAGATPSFTEEAFLAARALIDGLGDQLVVAPQLVREVGERGPTDRLAVVESERSLSAARRAESAAAIGLELDATDRADRPRLPIVTRIVTHGVRAHAATAWVRSTARASSKRS